MANKVKRTKEQVAAAISGTGKWKDVGTCAGVIQTVADRLNVDRRTVVNYLDRWPDLQPLLEVEREAMLDVAENKLFSLARQGNLTALIFFLKTQGKHRGWVERQEVAGSDGKDIVINVVYGRPRTEDVTIVEPAQLPVSSNGKNGTHNNGTST